MARQDVIALAADLTNILENEWSDDDFCAAMDATFLKRGINPHSLAGDGQTAFLRRVSEKWWIKFNLELFKWQAIESSMSLSSEAIRALTPAQALARITADWSIIKSRRFTNKEEFMAACREMLEQYGGDQITMEIIMAFDRLNEKHWDDGHNP
jgi:hypothetical protein